LRERDVTFITKLHFLAQYSAWPTRLSFDVRFTPKASDIPAGRAPCRRQKRTIKPVKFMPAR
jgi:hypothetical protein